MPVDGFIHKRSIVLLKMKQKIKKKNLHIQTEHMMSCLMFIPIYSKTYDKHMFFLTFRFFFLMLYFCLILFLCLFKDICVVECCCV